MCSARVGSNPILVGTFFLISFFKSHSSHSFQVTTVGMCSFQANIGLLDISSKKGTKKTGPACEMEQIKRFKETHSIQFMPSQWREKREVPAPGIEPGPAG